MELKAGVGGDEAALFVSDLLRMYGRAGETNGWQVEVIAREENESGRGIKSSVLEMRGEGAYDCLRWESGVHRVQRVPETERSGRVHTSTAAVVVSLDGLQLYSCGSNRRCCIMGSFNHVALQMTLCRFFLYLKKRRDLPRSSFMISKM